MKDSLKSSLAVGWSVCLLVSDTLILPFKCCLFQQSLLKGDNREHERPWLFGWGGQQQNGQRRRRKVDKIFKTKYKIEENLSLPIGLGPVTSGTRGLEQWQVCLNLYLAIWLCWACEQKMDGWSGYPSDRYDYYSTSSANNQKITNLELFCAHCAMGISNHPK